MPKPELTIGISVRHLPEQSDPANDVHAFAYTASIRNSGDTAVQLIARHWVITDANGRVDEVRGLGVVGQQPLLKPGETFEYTSWTRLATRQGTMRGTFFCITQDAERFDAPIAEFGLTLASSLH